MIKEPLDIEYWMVNVFSGSTLIFTLIATAFITFLAAKFKMQTSVFVVFLVLFSAIMMATGESALLVLAILIGAPILFWIIRRTLE